jgi:predicted nucleic acid-binding protein
MYLIDTSVWIAYLRNQDTPASAYFANILENKISFGLTEVIYQEILQGASSLKDFKNLDDYLKFQEFYSPTGLDTYKKAAELYFSCRKKGKKIRSTIDCLIAQIAIEHDLILVHDDRDYVSISEVHSKLKLYD